MIEYREFKPSKPELVPYVDYFVHVNLNSTGWRSKDILPRPGVSIIFTDKKIWINDNTFTNNILIGFHSNILHFRWETDRITWFVIRFSPYGLSRFFDKNPCQISNKSVESREITGSDIDTLYDQVMSFNDISKKMEITERFFFERLKASTGIEEDIFTLADILRHQLDSISFNDLRKRISISTRHLERKFKQVTGVTMQTYLRICRFENAKWLIIYNKNLNLTDIGYASGYFDQPHFSREFKKLSKHNPKDFLGSSPIYKFLSDLKLEKI